MIDDSSATHKSIVASIQRQPYVLMKLAENALTVAESLRGNYFKNTAALIVELRQRIHRKNEQPTYQSILELLPVADTTWNDVLGEVVTFIDGGVGQVSISAQVPILIRVGSYCVRTGERAISEREQFGYYPLILGDLEGGSKERKDFIDIVRITAELLGGLSALKRTPNLRLLMFHGPLVYLVGGYAGHTPFTERDIDIFLGQYAHSEELAKALKEEFLLKAKLEIYPQIAPDRSDDLIARRLFEPLSWMAFLYRKLIDEAKTRNPVPIIAGVVERGELREFSGQILDRFFYELRKNKNENFLNSLFGRTDLTSPKSTLERLGYSDGLLLAMIMGEGERTESWTVNKYESLHKGRLALPGESFGTECDWAPLKPPNRFGFPNVAACYVHVSENKEPVRVEVFEELYEDQVEHAARRTYLYSRLLPRYGFPVGLDIVDKYAHIPSWLTEAYSKLIRYHLGVSLQRGEITDEDMRRILVQAIYMTHRDWLFRPEV